MAVDPYGRRQNDPQHKQNLVPQNPRLWAMLQNEARQRFDTYPSIPASKWIHNEYVKRGGIFVESGRNRLARRSRESQHHRPDRLSL